MALDKKQGERAILDSVYDATEFALVAETEVPDFKIRHKYENSPFGVEITEFHQSGSDARLRHIPNYFTDILSEETYRHKDDKHMLRVEDVSVTSAEGKDKGSFRAIFRQLPSTEDYVQMFVQVLERKETRVANYSRGLTHVNLVVLDNVHRLAASRVEDFYYHFFRSSLKEALYTSGFREVLLVTVLNKDRWVYIPLKLMLLIADFYMFAKIVADSAVEATHYPSEESDHSIRDFMLTFAAYMRTKTDNVRISDDNGQIEVIFGNSGILLEEERIVVRDHYDYPYQEDVRPVGENEMALFSSTEFLEKEKKLSENYIFSTEIAYDLKGEMRF